MMDVPRYTANEIEDFIYDGMDPEVELVPAQCYAALEAERGALAARINADGAPVDVGALCLEIDAVTDERDELRRRLEKMKSRIYEGAESACYCGDGLGTCEYCEDALVLVAIAEGRDNG